MKIRQDVLDFIPGRASKEIIFCNPLAMTIIVAKYL
jgi:intergrase/recombinase